MSTTLPFRVSPLVRALSLGGVFFALTGCALLNGNGGPRPVGPAPTRTELVAINLQESSGWVAYRGSEEPDPDLENYRFLVIRQSSGEVIYDSIVPLAANLKTHGFEMEPNDPRLRNLARNVDQNIIAPMEAYKRRLEADNPEGNEPPPAPAPPPVSAPEPTPTPAPRETTAPERPATPVTAAPEIVDGPPSSLTGVTVLSMADNQLTLDTEPAGLLKVGDRIFLRHPPKVIELPGMAERILTQGEVAGLVRVTAVAEGAVTAELLSGEVPDQVYFERETESP